MPKMIFLVCMVLFLSSVSLCEASSITRTFSRTSGNPGEDITVSLSVSITAGEAFYAIDESYPSGWAVISTSGDTNQYGHIKWVIIQGGVNTDHTYVIRAPASSGSYTFSGLYMFENMSSEANVTGQTQVTLSGIGSCGNRICDSGETCSSCPGDCGQCQQPPPPSTNGGNGGGGGGGAAPACLNGQTRNCSISYKGYCATGNETCINAEWKGCPQPMMELCNRIDDDCDDKVDQGLNCQCYDGDKRPCGSDTGECRKGIQTCVNSDWDAMCYGEVKPVVEVCNGADDDCDGTVDEECKEQLSFKPCPDGKIPETGCICEQKIYSSGLCFSNKYYEGNVIRDWTMPIIGTAFVLIFAVIFIRWRHRRLKAQFKV